MVRRPRGSVRACACPVSLGLSRGSRRCGAPCAGATVRFEDTDRWARGRLLAALLAGEEGAGAGRTP